MPNTPAEKNRVLGVETVAQLEQLIITGQLKPGQKLTESALARQLGISRGPLREAIRTLEARRLVERKEFAGVRVVDLSVDEIEQLLITREALEGMASRQAAENMTLREARQLRALHEEMKELVETRGLDGAMRVRTEYDFHVEIARGSRNRFLMDFICRDLNPLLSIFRYRRAQMRQGRFAVAAEEHAAIVTAIERRQPDEAERLMRLHIASGRETLMQHLRQPGTKETAGRREPRKAKR